MRWQTLPQAESEFRRPLFRRLGAIASGPAKSLVLCTASFLLPGAVLAAQANTARTNPASAPAATPVHRHVHPHKKLAAAKVAAQPTPPPAPVVPKLPDWPANDQPSAASVVFDSRGLLIVASNSSLDQILKEVSTETGAKVEGMGTDQRVFGTYGPGPARDVLSHLLDGSGYDVLMIGDRGEGTPRRIVLTVQSGSGAKTTASNASPPPSNADTDADETPPEPEAEQEPQQPPQNGAGPPVPMRTPQQILEEIRERQQQMQNAQQNPQN